MVIVLLLGAVVIVGLACYAGRLLWLVHKQKEARLIDLKKADDKRQAQVAFILESLRVIATNVIDENLNLSEATLRSKLLLDGLLLDPETRQPYQILDVVFDQVSGFATHAVRDKLSALERANQDSQREAIEQENEAALTACFELLRGIGLSKETA